MHNQECDAFMFSWAVFTSSENSKYVHYYSIIINLLHSTHNAHARTHSDMGFHVLWRYFIDVMIFIMYKL